MRHRHAWWSYPIAVLIGVPLLFVALCWAVYAWSARFVPETLPATTRRAPDRLRAQYLAIETGGATRLPRLNPVTFWGLYFDRGKRFGTAPDRRLLAIAARHAQHRHWNGGSQGERHLAGIAYTIDVSRQWSFDQAVDTLLAESYFGRCSVGIEAAARAYFGVSAEDLRPQESHALIALLFGPSRYDLDLHRDRFERRFAETAETLGNKGPEWTPAAALARLRPAACAHRRG